MLVLKSLLFYKIMAPREVVSVSVGQGLATSKSHRAGAGYLHLISIQDDFYAQGSSDNQPDRCKVNILPFP